MPLVHIPVGIAPVQISDFPEKVGEGDDARPFERSCKGALFLQPSRTKVMSDDEVEFLRTSKDYKAIGDRLRVVKVDVRPDDSARSTGVREPKSPAGPSSAVREEKPKETKPWDLDS